MTRTSLLRDSQIKLLVGFSQPGLENIQRRCAHNLNCSIVGAEGANIEGVLGSVNGGVHLYVLFAVVTSV